MNRKRVNFYTIAVIMTGALAFVMFDSCKSTEEASQAKAPVVETQASIEAKKTLGIIGAHFEGKNCRAGDFDLPEGSTETLVFEEDGKTVRLDGTGHGITSKGTYIIDTEKKQIVMTFTENGSGLLYGTYANEECSELKVEGKVQKAILSLTLTGDFIRQK